MRSSDYDTTLYRVVGRLGGIYGDTNSLMVNFKVRHGKLKLGLIVF
jgi:hypothetical protein